jgi:hypothetical protein
VFENINPPTNQLTNQPWDGANPPALDSDKAMIRYKETIGQLLSYLGS